MKAVYNEDGSVNLAETMDLLRMGETIEYEGWTLTAEKMWPKSLYPNNNIWITAVKGEMKDSDDVLTWLLHRISEK